MWSNPQFPANLVTFTKETFNEKLYFLCSAYREILKSALVYLSVNEP